MNNISNLIGMNLEEAKNKIEESGWKCIDNKNNENTIILIQENGIVKHTHYGDSKQRKDRNLIKIKSYKRGFINDFKITDSNDNLISGISKLELICDANGVSTMKLTFFDFEFDAEVNFRDNGFIFNDKTELFNVIDEENKKMV